MMPLFCNCLQTLSNIFLFPPPCFTINIQYTRTSRFCVLMHSVQIKEYTFVEFKNILTFGKQLSIQYLRDKLHIYITMRKNFLIIYYFEFYNFTKNIGTERRKIKRKSQIIPFHRRCVCSSLSLSDTVSVPPLWC